MSMLWYWVLGWMPQRSNIRALSLSCPAKVSINGSVSNAFNGTVFCFASGCAAGTIAIIGSLHRGYQSWPPSRAEMMQKSSRCCISISCSCELLPLTIQNCTPGCFWRNPCVTVLIQR